MSASKNGGASSKNLRPFWSRIYPTGWGTAVRHAGGLKRRNAIPFIYTNGRGCDRLGIVARLLRKQACGGGESPSANACRGGRGDSERRADLRRLGGDAGRVHQREHPTAGFRLSSEAGLPGRLFRSQRRGAVRDRRAAVRGGAGAGPGATGAGAWTTGAGESSTWACGDQREAGHAAGGGARDCTKPAR